ncbi:hypothetical protein CK623_11050 [Vandammella animalimorsus]|uniref:Oxidoreductase molybdopterin-binding domain-containing protein n=1 Tax=Vandammella animalimorsus TaxID=2029117 RepID=A0A2A2AFS0_9BURK|nr:hypothetical protein CK625_10630 [Vandammella animalimorsus]PAT39291.1 hypothetical protein CK623_11050 [Vandammella animalimorsus]
MACSAVQAQQNPAAAAGAPHGRHAPVLQHAVARPAKGPASANAASKPRVQQTTPQAQPLPAPAQQPPGTAPVLLRIQTPWHDTLNLTEQDLLALPQVEVRTSTPWTDGTRSFRGPLLREVLKLAGRERDVQSMSLLAKSLNDYHVQIPASDAWKWDVIIALRMNGHPMSRRDKGPLWIIYPRDSHAELKRPHYDHRWPWQLHFIELYELPATPDLGSPRSTPQPPYSPRQQ